jgi:rfaE bifunctional protein kinase chain/domain
MWKEKKSKIHGIGVTASRNIKKGSNIIQYVGEKITKKEGDKRSAERIKKYLHKKNEGSVYIFELNSRYDIDGSPLYNKARYINHSCNPNCEVDIKENEIWIKAIKTIKKGDELCYDYGYEFDADDFADHICKCGSKNCVGYIVSQSDWPKLKKFKKNMSSKIIRKNILHSKKANIKNCNIVCIGDIILDHYIYGNVNRMSPEAPIPILLFNEENFQIGGAGNVARNLSSLGATCSLVTLFGKDIYSKKINELILNEKNINHVKINLKNYKTPIKTRYINKSKHLLRVDKEDNLFKISQNLKKLFLILIDKKIKKSDLVILSDYNKGFLDKDLIQKIVGIANKYNKTIIADPKKKDFSAYFGIDIITPNHEELENAAGKKLKNDNDLISFCKRIIKKHKIKEILLTRAEKGMLLIGCDYHIKLKANAKKVCDVTGAGDTVISILGLMKAIGMSTKKSSQISNQAAGIIIGKQGTAALTYNELFL